MIIKYQLKCGIFTYSNISATQYFIQYQVKMTRGYTDISFSTIIRVTTELVNTYAQNQTQLPDKSDDGMSSMWAIQFMVFRVAYLIIIISGTVGNI